MVNPIALDTLIILWEWMDWRCSAILSRFLSACVTKSNDGYRLHFGAGGDTLGKTT